MKQMAQYDNIEDLKSEVETLKSRIVTFKSKVETLWGMNDDLIAKIKGLREELAALKDDLPETLIPRLQAVWDIAEPTEIVNKGDLVICRVNEWNFRTYRSRATFTPAKYDHVRILIPAPREPWQGLADDLADRSTLMGDIETAAKALHAAGWRKGGDES